MSRLPRLPTLTPNPGLKTTATTTSDVDTTTTVVDNLAPAPFTSVPKTTYSVSTKMSLKRKHDGDDAEDDHPRKLSNSGGPSRVVPNSTNGTATTNGTNGTGALRTNKQANNLGNKPPSAGAPAPLTKPRAPSFSTRSTTRPPPRATSLPPRSNSASNLRSSGTAATTTRPGASRPATRSTASRPLPGKGRTVSGSFAPSLPNVNEDAFQALQDRMANMVREQMDTRDDRIAADMDAERAKIAELQSSHLALSRDLAVAKTAELTRRKELDSASDEIEAMKKKHAREMMDVEMDMRRKDRELRELKEDLRNRDDDLHAERDRVATLRATVSEMSTTHIVAESQRAALQAQLSTLQCARDSDQSTVSGLKLALEAAQGRILTLEEEARTAEMLRRKLHNTIQELKGNIRVFCRVRPLLSSEIAASASITDGDVNMDAARREEEIKAQMDFPDKLEQREIVLQGSSESAMGQQRKETWNFAFDRVFEPGTTQATVFEEVSQLAQSVTDGYNVCIFAYGQTGSGKSFTMEGGVTESTQGMIPRAVEQVFRVAEELRPKGWEYKMEGQFLEIYNETINDLLGNAEFDKKKHEIKHDPKLGTRVTDTTVLPLGSAMQVRTLLSIAQSRRTVAATLMNERSSRSHSVFTLRVSGVNTLTGERCEGSLNLVDLAGSERLNASGAGSDKERLKETQAINKSLSALGDVIAALGEKGEKGEKHIPYRNSKLTYLLQNSLSGNSKTLMILNISPLAASLGESLCSLRFATKVNSTTIGIAKRQIKKDAAP